MAGDEGSDDFVCPNCGEPVQPTWQACPSCGTEFEGSAESAPSPPVAAPAAARPPPGGKPTPPPQRAAPPAPPKQSASPPAKSKKAPGAAKTKGKRGRSKLALVGVLVLVVGLLGFFVAMNYDTIVAGQTTNTIGPNQFNAMVAAAGVAAAGGVIAFLGLVRARPAPAPRALAEPTPKAPGRVSQPPPAERRPAPVPAAAPEPEEPVPELYPEPEPVMAEPEPAPAAAAVASIEPTVEEEVEEEVDVVITREPEPAVEVEAERPAPAAEDFSPPPLDLPSAAPAAPKDELEDLFGELESHVAAANDEEVHYECPNCHGIVKEDDTTCPHCQVVFEG